MICWSSEHDFAIGVQFRAPNGELYAPAEQLVSLDSGFGGDLLVPFDLYLDLELEDWEEQENVGGTLKTVSGEILQGHLSRGILVIPNLNQEFRVNVHSFVGNTEFLIGMGILRRIRTLLDGPANQACIITEVENVE